MAAVTKEQVKNWLLEPWTWLGMAIGALVVTFFLAMIFDEINEAEFERKCVLTQGKIVKIVGQDFCQDPVTGKVLFAEVTDD